MTRVPFFSPTINQKGVRIALILLAMLQFVGSAALYSVVTDGSHIAIPAPFRLTSVLLLQAAVTAIVAVAGRWRLRQQAYAAACFTAICCVALYFLYQSYAAGSSVDVEEERYLVEGVILIVILCGFAVLNLLFAARLPNRSVS